MNLSRTNNFTPERYSPAVELGLNTNQIEERKANKLTNYVKKSTSKSYFNIFFSNICTFFNMLGVIVCIALLAVEAPVLDFFFAVIYLANISIGIIQEIRAKQCIDKLSLVSSKTTKAVRNGEIVEIFSNDIVLDDILKLGIGNQVPTDCKILEGEIEVNEALLTGESVPVKKGVGDFLFAGSFITAGVCTVIAHKVGKENYVQELSKKAKRYKKPNSQLMNSLRLIIKSIGLVIIPFAITLLTKALIKDPNDYNNAIRTTATSIIGMIPSGMFLLTSLALAVGIIKLARHKTLVQDLYSLEMLARVDTICFDKTGTITDGNMTVNGLVNLKEISEQNVKNIMSSMVGSLKDNNQTANALLNYFGNEIVIPALKTLPFNSARKFSAVTFENGKTYAFGAPEFVLSEKEYAKIKDNVEEYAKQGLRVLLLAQSPTALSDDLIPSNFKPLSIILLADNIREDAIETINWFKQNGVHIKVISGDNPITVSEVSKRVGIEGAENYISLEGLSDEEVEKIANDYTVFGRVTPEQKAILIRAIKKAEHVTAMTGDGINDILALKEADCAISVAAGSDAAKNVSHLILTDNNFNSLPEVVYEGRRVINNVETSASLFLMKTLFTMAMTIFSLIYYKNYPFKLQNMALLEIFVIGLPAFFLSLQPNNARVEGNFIDSVIKKSVPSALLMFINVFIIASLGKINIQPLYKTMAVYVLTYSGIISLLNICRPLNTYRSVLFFTNLLLVIIGTIIAMTNAKVGGLFGLIILKPFADNWKSLLILGAIIVSDIPISILLKKLFDKIFSKK